MKHLAALFLASALAGGMLACAGGGGSASPSPSPSPSPTLQNPCDTAGLDEPSGLEPTGPANPLKGGPIRDPGGAWRVLDPLWAHQAALERGLVQPLATPVTADDIGDVAVLHDEGDLLLLANPWDLTNKGLKLIPNDAGGYNVTATDATFRSSLGNRVTLGDDDSVQQSVMFGFPFFRKTQTAAFVNSDGNVTFEEEDRASTERNVSRLLTGPPRVAPLLADLDPTAGGRIYVQSASDVFTVTWCDVKGFDSQRVARVQVSLVPDGSIELKYATGTNLLDAVVGVAPGRSGDFKPVDLSTASSLDGGAAAVGERFSQGAELDLVATARKFYATHPDAYDQLIVWTDRRVTRDAFAFEVTVANEVQGIGVDVYDTTREFGSAGQLRSFVNMDTLTKYPDDPTEKFLGENNTLSVLGQEVGHRWLAFVRFRDYNGRISDALLGRDRAHWSFFMNSEASVMEGNGIQDLGGGSFRTVEAVRRYSHLDQYLMGFIGESDVPPFFYVESPLNVNPPVTQGASSEPQTGVTFNGTRRDVLIQDVIAVNGSRQPSAAESAKVFRQAFIYIVSDGKTAPTDQVDKVERIRRQWASFFTEATGDHGRVETRLRPGT